MRGFRRTAYALLLLLLIAAPVLAQPVDMIVVLDTSVSMLPYYEDLVEYLIRGILRDYLRFADTFHLIAFAGDSTVEVIQEMRATEDIEAVLRHVLLMHPLGQHTDLVRALRFLHAYVQRLPEDSRKTILLMSDGRHEPPPGSQYDVDADAVRSQLFETARTIRRQGWEVRLLRLPTGEGVLDLTDSLPSIQVPPDEKIPDQTERLADALESQPGDTAPSPEGQQPDSETEAADPRDQRDSATPPQEAPPATERESATRPPDADPADQAPAEPEARPQTVEPSAEPVEPDPERQAEEPSAEPGDPPPSEQDVTGAPTDDDGADQQRVPPPEQAPETQEPDETVEREEEPSDPAQEDPDTGQPRAEESDQQTEEPEDGHLPELSEELDAPLVEYDEDRQESLTSEALGIPQVTFPDDLGSVRRRFVVPLGIRNNSEDRVSLTLIRMQWDDTNILRRPASVTVPPDASTSLRAPVALPEGTRAGEHTITVRLVFRDDERVSPSTGELSFTLQIPQEPAGSSQLLRFVWIGLLAILILAALVAFFFLARRATERRKGGGAGQAETLPQVYYHEGELRRPIEMRVVGQNPKVGMRNIHTLRPGTRLSVGGRKDAFFIFLVRVPGHVAELRFDGNVYTFVPTKPEFFPELSAPLPSFLGQPITLLSKDGRRLTLYFREWISPLEEVNRIMHLADKPGRQ